MNKNYQVLARKYRPHNFKEMVGQDHTIKTLVNAIENNNLHHAFLFTGTRGVGKTTIARIFAKAINCQKKIDSNPCGKCDTCLEIDKGESIDLIELDAASNTGIENMLNILENTQYAPTKNRYKIYLIDEVHMLSKSSFNALLKTLEEPPEYVKFLLATTDPKALPVTILSRCLQFVLNKLTPEQILTQLKFIMKNEGLKFEEQALIKIADFGNGSMRDAISLLDQSISYGNGKVTNKDINNMLNLVSHNKIITLAKYLFDQDTENVINFAKDLSYKGENLEYALKALITIFHKISIAKGTKNAKISKDEESLKEKISSQDLQLFYHIATNGIKDLSLAPSEQIGFEMTLLKMITFRSEVNDFQKKNETIKPKEKTTIKEDIKDNIKEDIKETKNTIKTDTDNIVKIKSQDQWENVITSLKFDSAENTLLKNTIFIDFTNKNLKLSLDKSFSSIFNNDIKLSIQDKLKQRFGKINLEISFDELKQQTLATKELRLENDKMKKMQESFVKNAGVKKLQKIFDGKVDLKSIKKIKS